MSGPAAKALGGTQFLARTVYAAARMRPAAVPGVAALLSILATGAPVRRAKPAARETDAPGRLLPILLSAAFVVAAGIALSHAVFNTIPILPKAAIYFVLLACPAIGLRYGWLLLRDTEARRESQYCLLAGVSFVTASAPFAPPTAAFADFGETPYAWSSMLDHMRWQYLIAGAVAFIAGFLSRFLG